VPPLVLAQLTDLHVRAGDDDQTAARGLEAAVAAVLKLDPAPVAVLITGDLAEHGTADEYGLVRELLAPLTVPLHVLPGNHDDPARLASAFGTPGAHSVRAGPLRVVLCDTTLPDTDAGSMDRTRLEWLDTELAAEPDTPTILAMHHAPIPIGIAQLDTIGLPDADRAALATLVAGYPQVQRIVAGHVHRAAVGELGGRPVFICPSTYLQAKLDLTEPGEVVLVPEPAEFAIHVLTSGELTSHVVTLDGGAGLPG